MTKEEHKKPKKHFTPTPHKKVFDVSRPGKAPASPTSRPVIASAKPPVADDQFVPTAPPVRASDPFTKHDLMDPKNKKELQPLDGSGQTEPATAVAAAATSAVPVPASAPAVPGAKAVEVPQTAADNSIPGAPVAPTTPTTPTTPDPSDSPNPTPEQEPATAPVPAEASVANQDQPVSAESDASVPSAATPAQSTVSVSDGAEAVEEEETPAHLAMEQTVNVGDDNLPIWEHPDTSQQVEGSTPQAAKPGNTKSIEDLLAETGAPILEPEKTPSLVVSHHNKSGNAWRIILILLVVFILVAIVLDLLLDTELIGNGLGLPHTDLIN